MTLEPPAQAQSGLEAEAMRCAITLRIVSPLEALPPPSHRSPTVIATQVVAEARYGALRSGWRVRASVTPTAEQRLRPFPFPGGTHRLGAMSMTVNVPDDVARRLEAAAAARGVTVEELAAEVLTDHVPDVEAAPRRRHLSFAAIGASKHGISHQVDELLADGFGRD